MPRPLTSLRAHSGSTFQHSADLRNELEEAILAYTHGYADNLRQFFLQNDKAKTGQLSDILFRRALRSIGIHGPVELLNRAIEESTDLKSGLIDYEAFLGLFAFKGDIPPEGERGTSTIVHSRYVGNYAELDSQTNKRPSSRSSTQQKQHRDEPLNLADVEGDVPAQEEVIAGAPTSKSGFNLQEEMRKAADDLKRMQSETNTEFQVGLKLIATQVLQKGSCVKVFRTKFDRNHKGNIGIQDFLLGVRYLGIPSDLISNDDLVEIFQSYCTEDGTISVIEFEAMVNAGEDTKDVTRTMHDRQARSVRDPNHDVALLLEEAQTVGASGVGVSGERRPLRRTQGTPGRNLTVSNLATTQEHDHAESSANVAESTTQQPSKYTDEEIVGTLKRRIASHCSNKYSSFGDCMADAQDYNRKITPDSLRRFVGAQVPNLDKKYVNLLVSYLCTQENLRQSANSLGISVAEIQQNQGCMSNMSEPAYISAVVFNDLYKLPTAADGGKRRMDDAIWTYITTETTLSSMALSKAELMARSVNNQRSQALYTDDPPTPGELQAHNSVLGNLNMTSSRHNLTQGGGVAHEIAQSQRHSKSGNFFDTSAAQNDDITSYVGCSNVNIANPDTPSTRRLRQSGRQAELLTSQLQNPTTSSKAERASEIIRTKRQLLEAMNNKRSALAEALAMAADRASDPISFRNYLKDFTSETLTNNQIQCILEGSLDSNGKIQKEVVLKTMGLDNEFVAYADSGLESSKMKNDRISDNMVCISAVREQMMNASTSGAPRDMVSSKRAMQARQKQESSIMKPFSSAELDFIKPRTPNMSTVAKHQDSSAFSKVVFEVEKNITEDYEGCLAEATEAIVGGYRRRHADGAPTKKDTLVMSNGGVYSLRDRQMEEAETNTRRVKNTQRYVQDHSTPVDAIPRRGRGGSQAASQLSSTIGNTLKQIDEEYLVDYQSGQVNEAAAEGKSYPKPVAFEV